jgi:hypothetical protein
MTCQPDQRTHNPASAVTGPVTDKLSIHELADILSDRLETSVRIVADHLPDTCACTWTRLGQAGQISFNTRWLITPAEMIAHAAGHLMLGHCERQRQFACVIAGVATREIREQVRAILPDGESIPLGIFDHQAEQQAEDLACLFLDRLGQARMLGTPVLTCIG